MARLLKAFGVFEAIEKCIHNGLLIELHHIPDSWMETEQKRPDQGRGKRKDLASRAARCAGERNDARYIKSRGAGRGPLPEGNSFLIDRVHIVIVTLLLDCSPPKHIPL
jgi:hypothetical protein